MSWITTRRLALSSANAHLKVTLITGACVQSYFLLLFDMTAF